MQRYEYTVIPAPARGEKVRGARTGAERFSYALLTEMNRMAAQGWEYVRAETLPCEERSGLTSRTTVYHNLLVFRRDLSAEAPARVGAAQAPVPAAHRPAPAPAPEPAADWPDGAEDAETAAAEAQAARVDNYDEPGFDPAPEDASPDRAAEAPAFTQRPPLAASRGAAEAERPAFGQPMPAAHRLGPAER